MHVYEGRFRSGRACALPSLRGWVVVGVGVGGWREEGRGGEREGGRRVGGGRGRGRKEDRCGGGEITHGTRV